MQLRSFVNICERCVHSYKLKGYFKEATSKFKPQKKKRHTSHNTIILHACIQKRQFQKPRELLSFIQRKLLGNTLFTVV